MDSHNNHFDNFANYASSQNPFSSSPKEFHRPTNVERLSTDDATATMAEPDDVPATMAEPDDATATMVEPEPTTNVVSVVPILGAEPQPTPNVLSTNI